ncbi:unnamed protein product [Parnassius apollo]|uniref:(apollo) hypothetical protein n=1 Tax=Parnassius apollo TaxID=110799 RepID=A0A8S3XV36_PARAO|nr:unnamed protein product [Parnassius apollo]
MDLLRERCKQIFSTNSLDVDHKQAEAIIWELHEIYVLLTKNFQLFNSLLSPVMFFYVIMCSLKLCFSAFELTSTNDATQKLLVAEYLVFGITQLFLFCWHSNDVLEKILKGAYSYYTLLK